MLRQIVAIVLACTIGAMAVEIVNGREIANLRVGIEQSYDLGFADGVTTQRMNGTLSVMVRDLPDGAQEIVPVLHRSK